MNINELAKTIHQNNVEAGWWDDPNRDLNEVLMLIVTEIAEATEGVRKNLMDDHLPHRKMEEVELADTMIRLLDLAGNQRWEYRRPMLPSAWDDFRYDGAPDASYHLAMVHAVISLHASMCGRSPVPCDTVFSQLVCIIILRSVNKGYNLEAAMTEKMEYNKHRADHKPENRAADGGKKF